MKTAPPEEAIRHLLDWESKQAGPRRLALWLVVALILHAGAFMAFKVIPPAVDRIEPSTDAVIALVLSGSEARESLDSWLDLRDPALFAAERADRVVRYDPAPPPYLPGFMNITAPARPMPERPNRVMPPLPSVSGPVAINEGRNAGNEPTQTRARPTEIAFSGDLAGRRVISSEDSQFVARPGDHLEPAKFLMCVGPDGRVLHVFEQTATVFEDINAEAARSLHQIRFDPGPEITWGTATFYWGADVERRRVE